MGLFQSSHVGIALKRESYAVTTLCFVDLDKNLGDLLSKELITIS